MKAVLLSVWSINLKAWGIRNLEFTTTLSSNFPSKSARLNWVSENSRLDPSWAARYPLSAGVVDIAFYDKTGYSLFKNGQHSTLASWV